MRDQPRNTARSRRNLAEKRHKQSFAALGILIKRDTDQFSLPQRSQHRPRGRMFADYFHAGARAHPRHQRVAGQKALCVMYEAYLVAMHRMSRGQQFEAAEMRRQYQHAPTRNAVLDSAYVIVAVVRNPAHYSKMEKSAKPDVLGGTAAEINVGGPEDPSALGLAPLRKRDCEVLHPDFHVPAVEQITDVPADDAERIENEVRD